MRIWLARTILVLLCLGLALLVGRNAMTRLANENNAALPMALYPDDSQQSLLRAGLLTVDLQKSKIPADRILAAAQNASRIDSLDYRPFLVAAVSAQKSNKINHSISLLEAARLRQPREFNIRLLLMQAYVIAGRYDDAAREMFSGARLDSSSSDRLMLALAYMSQEEASRKALTKALASRSDWRLRFVNNNSAIDVAPELVFGVASNLATSPKERLMAVNALARRGKTGLAYKLWAPASADFHRGTFPVDSGFDGWAQSSAFGWKLINSSEAVVDLVSDEKASGGLLDVEYFGGSSAKVVQQPMLLPPGDYRMTVQGRHIDGQLGAGEYRWTVFCDGSQEPVGVTRIGSQEASQFNLYSEFTIPREGCASQSLQLIIFPGEMDRTMRSTFSSLRISPA